MRIQHNILAMNAYRNYNTNTSALAKNLEKLSSGYKINRAGDDAAGLAISEKMRAQITGLNAAQKNVKDGISLVKTAEGAMQEIQDMLNRMDYLATQSANGTYDDPVDRANLQKEMDALKSEINRIADSANFNGINLLDGSKAAQSTSALGGASATLLNGINGSAPSKAGAAEITLKLANNAASASTKLDTVAAQDGDGSNVIPATNAQVTIKVGGVAGDPATKIKVTGKIDMTGTGVDLTDAEEFNSGKWDGGSYLDITVGDTTYKFSHGTKDGYTDISGSTLAAELTKIGLTLDATDTTTNKHFITATAAEVSGFNGTGKITAGTTDITALKALQITGNAADTVGSMFDIKVNGDTKADGYKIQNGDEITLVAKTAGKMSEDAGKALKVLGSLAASTPAGSTGLAGSVSVTNGTDEGFASPAIETTKYEIKFDIANLAGGKKIDIGGKTLTFSALDASVDSTTNSATANIINLNEPDANADGTNVDEIAAEIETALNTMFDNTVFQTGAIKKNTDGTYTYSIEALANGTKNEDANLGQVRVFQANVDGTETEITDSEKAISATYSPKSNAPTGGPTPGAFASVQYNIDKGSFKAGNKLTIGGVEIEMVATADQDLSKGKVGVDANFGANLIKALEQNGYQAGQVTATGDVTAANLVLTIKGTTVGEKADELKEGAGSVSLLDATKVPASEATVAGAADMKITAGKTTIADLKKAAMPADADGNTKKLSDLFNITVNGSTQADDYVIKEGDEIKFTAVKNGRLEDAVMNKFKYDGKVDNLTSKNGWDEGEGASGDKTHYELAIDLTKVAGGNSFTFGNVNGKSITFDLSYDTKGTENDTIGADDKDDISGNSDRVTINLYGKTTAEAQEAIYKAVKTEMNKAGFDVTRAISGSKVTLNLDAQKEGDEYNLGNIRLSSASGALTNAVYNPAGGSAGGTKGTMAQVTYKFDVSQLQSGDSLTLGGTTIYIGDESKKETVDGKVKITVGAEEAKADPNDAIVKALESAGYRSGQVKFDSDNGTITITGIKTGETAEQLQKDGAALTLSGGGRELVKGGLTLQIGDTSDDFNQMTVSIGDMHTGETGLKIDGVRIDTQDGAKAAVQTIKDAINYVSSIRGDLGATQNRLEHTANNLSVMAENIQDAESTIRDTDVAEEMMAYTKNNILVQSAQAMLAQANAVPQGVLQLLG